MSATAQNATASVASAVQGLVWEIKANELATYVCVTIMALVPLYIGCHMSMSQRKPAKKTEDGKEAKVEFELETMSSKDAMKFPLVGSAFLFGLYVVYKLLPKEWVTLILNGYLLLFGMASLIACFRPLYSKLFSWFSAHEAHLPVWKVRIPYFLPTPTDITYLDAVNALICAGLAGWYMFTKHWIANNIIATAFAIQAIAVVSVGSYQIGCGLLSGLFFYDIFWVFGTDVMVTVARSFDGPIKVVWPKDLLAETYQFSMLGLGDIVIPGLFLALLLRYDFQRSQSQKSFQSTYFNVCFIGYILGLAVTMFVMHVFRAAQPALLYLVPACILFSAGTGLALGDFSGLLSYSELSSEEPEKVKAD
jgi:minor histocompatibility antigen H13